MTREAALRIALAARELPGVSAAGLVTAIVDRVGLPLSEAKLAALSVDDLREILAGDHADENCAVGATPEHLKAVIRLLWGEGLSGSELPPLAAYQEGDMPGSIRVACASNNDEALDGHFGSCERFLIYQVSVSEVRLVGIRPTLEADAAEDRNLARAALIADCQLAYFQSIGGPAAAKVVRAGVHPVKVPRGGQSRELLVRLQEAIVSPPPWLAKVMGVPAASLAPFRALTELTELAELAELGDE
jgi:nitrogen fixation protein NifX